MGEMVVSSAADDELVAIGLGSCIGLAMVDPRAGLAALAHIVLPDSQGAPGPAGKYADLAVPELLAALEGAGAQRSQIQVAIVGGAQMFAIGGGLDIGARNDSAVRDALERSQLRIHAESTGGNRGRTVRVRVGAGSVHVHEAGGRPITLLAQSARGRRAQPPAATLSIGIAGAIG